jgi:hypothetical protein
MTRTGYNAIALLSIVCATVLTALGTTDRDISMALVVLAGTVVGRGDKA